MCNEKLFLFYAKDTKHVDTCTRSINVLGIRYSKVKEAENCWPRQAAFCSIPGKCLRSGVIAKVFRPTNRSGNARLAEEKFLNERGKNRGGSAMYFVDLISNGKSNEREFQKIIAFVRDKSSRTMMQTSYALENVRTF